MLLLVAALLMWKRHTHKQSTTAGDVDVGLLSVSLQNDDSAENYGSLGDNVCQHESTDVLPENLE